MKRIIALSLLASILFSVPLSSFAAESEPNTGAQELANAKKLLYETARVLESKNNMIVVDEISQYDWYWANDPELTTEYINDFNAAISKNKSINQKRERLQYIYNQKKATALSALVPSALNLINVTVNAQDPLKAVIAISGTVLSSVTSYVDKKQKEDLDLIQAQWDLDDQQIDTFETLTENLRSYLSKTSSKYGYKNENLSSLETLRSFIKTCNQYSGDDEESARSRFVDVKAYTFQKELSIFPEYWAELAKDCFLLGEYETALEYIKEYENTYVSTMYHDAQHAYVMQIKAYCLMQSVEDIQDVKGDLIAIADSVRDTSTPNDRNQKYFCVKIYSKLAEKTGDTVLYNKAAVLMTEVVSQVANDYAKDLESFFNGTNVATIKNGIQENIDSYTRKIQDLENVNKSNVGDTTKKNNKAKIKEYKKEIAILKENLVAAGKMEDQFLPPNATLLYSMVSELEQLADCGSTKETIEYQQALKKAKKYLCDEYSRRTLFNGEKASLQVTLNYDRKKVLFVDPDDTAKITFPATYFVFVTDRFNPQQDKLSILLNDFIYTFPDYMYSVNKGTAGDLSDVSITFTGKVSKTVETGKSIKAGTLPRVTCKIDSDSMQLQEEILAIVDNPNDMIKTFVFAQEGKETK